MNKHLKHLKTFFCAFMLVLPWTMMSQQVSKRQMRAVWIATVGNIDWPSAKNLGTEQQKAEFINLLEQVKQYHMNTIVFQIRPAADAFYPSKLEPWSQWLNGKQGQAPEPFYDPLEFAIRECRKRGIDIHVWLNPYRAIADTSYKGQDANHLTRLHPEWFLYYGTTLYFNPGLQETRDFVSRVVSDIVRRYDIDAIHMDDYFYPYRIKDKEFPDSATFAKHSRGFSSDKKEDWRRDNVNLIIKQLHDSIHSIKPWVEFGISPFGVWRNLDKDPLGSKTKAGQTNYDDLYADILKWQREKWVDYITPQIYWEIGKKVADYKILADWWSYHAYGIPLYIGQGTFLINKKAKVKSWRTSKEIIKQFKLNSKYPNIAGSMHFSGKILAKNPLNIKRRLLQGPYRYQSLPPVNNHVSQILAIEPMGAKMTVSGTLFTLSFQGDSSCKSFVIYKFRKGKVANIENPASIFLVTSEKSLSFSIDKNNNPEKYFYAVSSLSKSNMESQAIIFE
jgi:uncharacterized lipoprotein YddW (UPF0748 family)